MSFTTIPATYDDVDIPSSAGVVTWRGAYNPTTTYVLNDAVDSGGSSYVATSSTLGIAPPAAPWTLLASVGATGPTGATGAQGPTGATGPQGIQGSQGNPGSVGPAGAVGPAGPQGIPGDQGPQGIQGPQGPVGITGATGATGPQGVQGNPGPQGTPGAVGPAGANGPAGPQGVQGPNGATGAQGPAGIGLNIKGTVPTYSALPPQPQPVNDAYSDDASGHLWASNGTQWIDTGLLRGPQGPAGVAGAQGPTGLQGVPGAVGPKGDQGVQGTPGIPGPEGPQGPPGDPFGTPTLAIGVIVHWRPPRSTFDRYGLCKPAIVTEVPNLAVGLVNAVVLGSQGSPVLLYDHVPTGVVEGHWHFISDCPYPMGLGNGALTRAFATLVGAK